MAVRLSWPMYPLLVFEPETIVLDTREEIEGLINLSFLENFENAKATNEYIEQQLQNLVMDICSKQDLEYSVTYSAYELMNHGFLEGTNFQERAMQLAQYYEAIARKIHRRLVELKAYRGDRLYYHYVRRFGSDIVLARIRVEGD